MKNRQVGEQLRLGNNLAKSPKSPPFSKKLQQLKVKKRKKKKKALFMLLQFRNCWHPCLRKEGERRADCSAAENVCSGSSTPEQMVKLLLPVNVRVLFF